MSRAFTTREKVMLVVLAVLLIAVCYFKFVLEPINNSVDQYKMDTENEQSEIVANMAVLQKMKSMQAELEEIYAAGDPVPMPEYDNSEVMLVELNSTLAAAADYTINFGSAAPLSENSYIMARTLSLDFETTSYATARQILDTLHRSENINQISDLSVSLRDNGRVQVTATISYFELAN